eukprot:gnl/Chilomastix_cuspidata/3003.p1 GENE.gnl/Chilomastix_cuspidata/3003~~gnl/Chilomastix_cuspidata/3003.p1  ORF type:complete len:657 (+),score=196.71 gnl/Chilomastix_cuspidata/3003:40-2010(+)
MAEFPAFQGAGEFANVADIQSQWADFLKSEIQQASDSSRTPETLDAQIPHHYERVSKSRKAKRKSRSPPRIRDVSPRRVVRTEEQIDEHIKHLMEQQKLKYERRNKLVMEERAKAASDSRKAKFNEKSARVYLRKILREGRDLMGEILKGSGRAALTRRETIELLRCLSYWEDQGEETDFLKEQLFAAVDPDQRGQVAWPQIEELLREIYHRDLLNKRLASAGGAARPRSRSPGARRGSKNPAVTDIAVKLAKRFDTFQRVSARERKDNLLRATRQRREVERRKKVGLLFPSEKATYVPRINARSRRVAERATSGLRAGGGAGRAHSPGYGSREGFNALQMARLQASAQSYEALADSVQRHKMRECSFHPNTGRSSHSYRSLAKRGSVRSDASAALGRRRYEHLYKTASEYQERHRERSVSPTAREREDMNECTFRPNTANSMRSFEVSFGGASMSRSFRHGTSENSTVPAGYDSVIQRMKYARFLEEQRRTAETNMLRPISARRSIRTRSDFEREQRDTSAMYSRDSPAAPFEGHEVRPPSVWDRDVSSASFSGSSGGAEDREDQAPLLLVNVNLDDSRTEQIAVFPGDTPARLAKKFASEHSLSPTIEGTLRELLRARIGDFSPNPAEPSTRISNSTASKHFEDLDFSDIDGSD